LASAIAHIATSDINNNALKFRLERFIVIQLRNNPLRTFGISVAIATAIVGTNTTKVIKHNKFKHHENLRGQYKKEFRQYCPREHGHPAMPSF